MKFYFVGFFVKIKVSHLQDSSTAVVVPTLVLFKVKVCSMLVCCVHEKHNLQGAG